MDDDTEKTEAENIKSTAVVKYSVPKPAKFTKLQCNTDLNMPPSNWLSNSTDSYGLQQFLYQQKGFTSFRMANMFPDCVGEVDVVSDAENIKNLLKIPYHKRGHISMMVHRIENTLLLDDFDIYKHLLRTAEKEWEWLRKFFYENVERKIVEEERTLYVKNKRRKALQQKSLVSKFLYYSLGPNESVENMIDDEEKITSEHGPVLPEPSPSTEVPDPSTFDHKYNRNVVWTFEDIEMLIGTDMPIFGGGTHPCISLRLNDMNKPINVLTGIDYWLDNLMSNVPEVVMCYHLNGIVQKYELIKTEDLPCLDNSKFSPKLIRDVAQGILSFLKSNATKAGHTYWLFKGKDEEVIKLYDLTSLCSVETIDNEQNPFTVPVAMLLYRVARNMKHSSEKRQSGTIRMLLKNCIRLLSEEKYPEIVTSSHYMLADLYVPSNINPENPEFDVSENDDAESVYDDDESNYDKKEEFKTYCDDKKQNVRNYNVGPGCTYNGDAKNFNILHTNDKEYGHVEDNNCRKDEATKVLSLNSDHKYEKFTNYYKPPPGISGTLEERCSQGIHHAASGLSCLKYFPSGMSRMSEDENVRVAKPNEPIPMPYAKLNVTNSEPQDVAKSRKRNKKKKTKVTEDGANALLLKNKVEAQPLPTWQESVHSNISWKDHLKVLLYEKVILTYATLAEHYYLSKTYGLSLRCIGIVVRCLQVLTCMNYPSNSLKENCVLGRAGDCCIMIVQNWDKIDDYKHQLQSSTDVDLKVLEQIEMDEQYYNIQLIDCDMKCVFIYDIRTIEQMLLQSVECYHNAHKVCNSDQILRRLGNSLNEIGTFYLNRAKNTRDESLIDDSCKKAEQYLKRGTDIFEEARDSPNSALLHTNMGHLHRFMAHVDAPMNRGELTQAEKVHYSKAFTHYKRALQVLGSRESSPFIWDAVKWELSTASFTMGCILHDNPPSDISKSEAEKEIVEILQKALSYCDLNKDNSKHLLYQFRAATIHYRLASIYHSHIWNATCTDLNRKATIQLARLNYEKSAKFYLESGDVLNYLTAQMQRVALGEYIAESANMQHQKLKAYQNCLYIMLELKEIMLMIVQKKVDIPLEDVTNVQKNEVSFKNCTSLCLLVKERLQHILKNLVKLCLSKPSINKDCGKFVDVYKKLYSYTFALENLTDFNLLAESLSKVLAKMHHFIKASGST